MRRPRLIGGGAAGKHRRRRHLVINYWKLATTNNVGIGCCVGGVFTNIFSYADDMILLAPSWSAMQQILELHEKNCITYSILCNTKKTVCMVFNPKCVMTLNGRLRIYLLDVICFVLDSICVLLLCIV